MAAQRDAAGSQEVGHSLAAVACEQTRVEAGKFEYDVAGIASSGRGRCVISLRRGFRAALPAMPHGGLRKARDGGAL